MFWTSVWKHESFHWPCMCLSISPSDLFLPCPYPERLMSLGCAALFHPGLISSSSSTSIRSPRHSRVGSGSGWCQKPQSILNNRSTCPCISVRQLQPSLTPCTDTRMQWSGEGVLGLGRVFQTSLSFTAQTVLGLEPWRALLVGWRMGENWGNHFLLTSGEVWFTGSVVNKQPDLSQRERYSHLKNMICIESSV